MRLIFLFFCVLFINNTCFAPPLHETDKKENDIADDNDPEENLEDVMEYHRYLKEVVAALESDPEFRDKLEKANESDIRSGKIAENLDFVNHTIRTQLDEIKRREMERLRHLATKLYEANNGLELHPKNTPATGHLDHENPHTFEIEDLKKLILQTTADLAESDRKRQEDFKRYEMEKEFKEKQKMNSMDESHKREYQEKLQHEKEEHKKHQPLHHPGSKKQFEEVWEKQDHMEAQEFDPKIFFMMHDVDGNGFWDPNEVKSLFIKELDKIYAQGTSGFDPKERYEEMERMREHFFKEGDLNRDGLLDYNEFIIQTRRTEYQKDPGWETLDQKQVYTQEEYAQFERQRMEELHRLQQAGMLDAYGNPVPVVGYDNQGRPIHQYVQQVAPGGYQAPVQYQQVPAPNQGVPPHIQQHPGQHNQIYQNIPVQNQQQGYQVPVSNQQRQGQGPPPQYQQQAVPQPPPISQNQGIPQHIPNQGVPVQNQAVPVQNQGLPPKNQGVPVQNPGVPVQNQGIPVQNLGVPVQNQGVPGQNLGVPVQNQGAPIQNPGIPVQNLGVVQHSASPVQNQGIPVQNQGVPVNN